MMMIGFVVLVIIACAIVSAVNADIGDVCIGANGNADCNDQEYCYLEVFYDSYEWIGNSEEGLCGSCYDCWQIFSGTGTVPASGTCEVCEQVVDCDPNTDFPFGATFACHDGVNCGTYCNGVLDCAIGEDEPVSSCPDFGWTCNPLLWGDGVECNCNCGIFDPDCYDNGLPIVGCNFGEVCRQEDYWSADGWNLEGTCMNGDTYYGKCTVDWVVDQECIDAGLGELYKDCNGVCFGSSMKEEIGNEWCDAFSLVFDCETYCWDGCVCDDADASQCDWGWTCDPLLYEDGQDCDCGCGIDDPDCLPDECVDGWTCNPVSYADGQECDCYCGIDDPDCDESECIWGWTCDTALYGDGVCHCDCGVVMDPDCVINQCNVVEYSSSYSSYTSSVDCVSEDLDSYSSRYQFWDGTVEEPWLNATCGEFVYGLLVDLYNARLEVEGDYIDCDLEVILAYGGWVDECSGYDMVDAYEMMCTDDFSWSSSPLPRRRALMSTTECAAHIRGLVDSIVLEGCVEDVAANTNGISSWAGFTYGVLETYCLEREDSICIYDDTVTDLLRYGLTSPDWTDPAVVAVYCGPTCTNEFITRTYAAGHEYASDELEEFILGELATECGWNVGGGFYIVTVQFDILNLDSCYIDTMYYEGYQMFVDALTADIAISLHMDVSFIIVRNAYSTEDSTDACDGWTLVVEMSGFYTEDEADAAVAMIPVIFLYQVNQLDPSYFFNSDIEATVDGDSVTAEVDIYVENVYLLGAGRSIPSTGLSAIMLLWGFCFFFRR